MWKGESQRHKLASHGVMTDKEWVEYNRNRTHISENIRQKKWQRYFDKHKEKIMENLRILYYRHILAYGEYKSNIVEEEGLIEIFYDKNNDNHINDIKMMINRIQHSPELGRIDMNTEEGIIVIVPKYHPSLAIW